MQNKKSLAAIVLALLSVMFSTFVISCSGGSEQKANSSDSSAAQTAPADSLSSKTDTTALDSASTRPVKSPN